MTTAEILSIRDAEHELDRCRVAEQAAVLAYAVALPRHARTCRHDLRAARAATVDAERALTGALTGSL